MKQLVTLLPLINKYNDLHRINDKLTQTAIQSLCQFSSYFYDCIRNDILYDCVVIYG